jgi:acyl-CoA synthetase (AMP-forming)/AMP-acid ligase II
VVSRAYFHRPEATALAKIPDPASGGFYHRMGDLGYFDDQGSLWFCGRKAHRVATAKGTLFTIPCEGVFNTHPRVLRTALVGVGPPGKQEPVLFFEPKPEVVSRDEIRTIEQELRSLAATRPHTADIRFVFFHRPFPVDIRHNAKIFREKLAVRATDRLKRQPAERQA